MAVHIRLTRVGATRRPAYRVIAIDSRRSRDGRALEILGFYDPLSNPITVKLDDERIANWMARGALPSAAVQRLMKVAAAGPTPKRIPVVAEDTTPKPRRASRPKRATAEPAPEAATDTTTEAEAEPAPEAVAEPAAESTAEAAPEEAADDPTSASTDAAAEAPVADATDATADGPAEATAEATAESPIEPAAETGADTEEAES